MTVVQRMFEEGSDNGSELQAQDYTAKKSWTYQDDIILCDEKEVLFVVTNKIILSSSRLH